MGSSRKEQAVSRKEALSHFIDNVYRLQRDDYDVSFPATDDPQLNALGEALDALAQTLHIHSRELHQIGRLTARINAGLLLDDILDNIYADFSALFPYNRISLALIDDDGAIVRTAWHKTDQPTVRLGDGYAAPLADSSLETIITTGQPRILNDLRAYLRHKPESKSTRLIVEEGIQSSLTCPLIANGAPIGFIFFSSIHPHAYQDAHIDTFQRIAGQLAVIVEKGRLASELAAQQQASERQNKELRRLNEMKNTFLGVAAHDLRSPLGTIQMAMGLLGDPEMQLSAEEIGHIAHSAQRQTRHMLALIEDLLDVAQIEAGRLELDPDPIDVAPFLAEVVLRHNALAEDKGTQVTLQAVAPGLVIADPHRLRQVMDNLISNAVKYSPAASTVCVRAAQQADCWRISVSDEGPGITPDDRPHLFEEFARLSARPTGGETSTGLGLAITQRIVEAHGGQIDVDSEPGHGATFWFTLPRQDDAHAT
jgi:signal transduction histidine kinase